RPHGGPARPGACGPGHRRPQRPNRVAPLLSLAGRLVVRGLPPLAHEAVAPGHRLARRPETRRDPARPDRQGLSRGIPPLPATRPRRPRPRGRAGAHIFRYRGTAVTKTRKT